MLPVSAVKRQSEGNKGRGKTRKEFSMESDPADLYRTRNAMILPATNAGSLIVPSVEEDRLTTVAALNDVCCYAWLKKGSDSFNRESLFLISNKEVWPL